jgi:dUTP pyrophosphatase
MHPTIKIRLLDKEAKVPTYGSEEAAGFDLYSSEDSIILPGETKKIKTSLSVEMPKGYHIQIWDRSGLGSKGIHRFAGVVDSDYRGEIMIVLHNTTKSEFKISKGDRIAQALLLPIIQASFIQSEELSETQRNQGGFGSTGK